ncbi:MAG: hypothetical protein MRJ67_05865 [Nitrospirales bacterium]|nr:hypothetical protein [Nitrospirales bacterium]
MSPAFTKAKTGITTNPRREACHVPAVAAEPELFWTLRNDLQQLTLLIGHQYHVITGSSLTSVSQFLDARNEPLVGDLHIGRG